MNQYGKDIIKHLDKVTSSGVNAHTIFDDFLDVTHATLTAIPAHLRSAVRERTFAADTPETAALFERLRSRYNSAYCWEHFSKAFQTLLSSTDGPDELIAWDDTIGSVYMDWGISNKHSGQFFTPYHLAQAMACMQDIESQVFDRLEQAYRKSSFGIMHEMLSPDRIPAFVRSMAGDLVPLVAEYIEPLKVNDCACGSGVMLLAAAEQTPRWARDWGLVQFSGMDIDATCIKMAQINCMLYGLNGYGMKCVLAMAPDELLALPQPYQSAYQQAQAEPDRALEISTELMAWKQESLL